MENIRIKVNERKMNSKKLAIHDLREELLPRDRLSSIQEELAGFLVKEAINPDGGCHVACNDLRRHKRS
jgi:hypothetical protein